MTHVVHPYAHRLGTVRDWKSRWFATGTEYRDQLIADNMLREYLEKRLKGSYVSSIEVERSRKMTKIILRTSRPGVIIGRNGEGVTALKKDLLKFMRKHQLSIPQDFKLDVVTVDNPDADAAIVAAGIVEALEKRVAFRRVMKMTLEKVMNAKGVKGARIVLTGLVGGPASMARREQVKKGGIPLQFIRGDVDYCRTTARMPHNIGVKVWIYRGDTLAKKGDTNRD